jgi:hypothetical protein
MENITGKYIGENQIRGIGTGSKESILGHKIVEVVFDTAEVVEYLEDILPTIITEEKSNASDLQNNFNNYLVKKILEILVDAGIKITDVNPLLDKISNSVSMNISSVNDILWGKDLYKRTM